MKAWALVLLLLTGCGATPLQPVDKSLIIAACPALTPLTDKSFGGTSAALIETSIQYNLCRRAALGNGK